MVYKEYRVKDKKDLVFHNLFTQFQRQHRTMQQIEELKLKFLSKNNENIINCFRWFFALVQ